MGKGVGLILDALFGKKESQQRSHLQKIDGESPRPENQKENRIEDGWVYLEYNC